MKKKIVSIALVVAMIAIIAAGSFAYFTDKDAQTNTFTVGNVKIDLFEDFTNDSKLIPAVGGIDPETGYSTNNNTVEKEVYVENTGAEKAYVRVHIAVPIINNKTVVDGKEVGWQSPIQPLWSEFTCHQGQWNWGKEPAANDKYEGLVNSGFNMNTYFTEIEGVQYCVYVGTYETALENGNVTLDAIDEVFMPAETTNEDINYWNTNYPNWKNVYVVAEAVQADGFDDAFTALNTAFGEPGSYEVDFTADHQGKTFVDRTGAEGK